jgi:succinyl-diaminopimelate desuccinylase
VRNITLGIVRHWLIQNLYRLVLSIGIHRILKWRRTFHIARGTASVITRYSAGTLTLQTIASRLPRPEVHVNTQDVPTLAQQVAQAVPLEEVIRLAQTLVRMDSVAAPGRPHEEKVARFLAERLEKAGLAVHVTEVAPLRLNVIAEWHGRGSGRTLLLEGHTDVVFEGPREAWSRDPFSGEIENGILHGRGSADMKGGLACAVVVLEMIAKLNPDLPGIIRLLIPCDEEGMMTGIKRMVADGWAGRTRGSSVPADGAIICEPEENELCLFQKGGIRIKVTFTGRQAHGAMPYAGLDPVPALARFVLEVRELQTHYQELVGEHPMLGLPWLTATVLKAGSLPQLNVMHANAMVALDVRTAPGVEHADLHHRLQTILGRLELEEGVKTKYEIIDDRPWTATDPNSSIVKALEAAHPFTLGRAPKYGGVPGTTDGTFLHAAGVPIVTVGPGDREIPHQPNEFVRVSELELSARLYAATAVLFLLES